MGIVGWKFAWKSPQAERDVGVASRGNRAPPNRRGREITVALYEQS